MKSCATSSPSACLACPATSASTRTCRSTKSRPRGDEYGRRCGKGDEGAGRERGSPNKKNPRKGGRKVADVAKRPPKARYETEDRVGVLEELLHERYSVR